MNIHELRHVFTAANPVQRARQRRKTTTRHATRLATPPNRIPTHHGGGVDSLRIKSYAASRLRRSAGSLTVSSALQGTHETLCSGVADVHCQRPYHPRRRPRPTDPRHPTPTTQRRRHTVRTTPPGHKGQGPNARALYKQNVSCICRVTWK